MFCMWWQCINSEDKDFYNSQETVGKNSHNQIGSELRINKSTTDDKNEIEWHDGKKPLELPKITRAMEEVS